MSEEGEEWVVDLLFSIIIGLGVIFALRSAPENLLTMILDIGEKILNHIHVSGQGFSISQDFRHITDFIYLEFQTLVNLIRFCIGFVPSFGFLRFRRKVVRKKRQNYWN